MIAALILAGLLSIEKGGALLLLADGYPTATVVEVSPFWCGWTWTRAAAYSATHYSGRRATGLVCCASGRGCQIR